MLDLQWLQEFQTKREDDWQRWRAQMASGDKKWREKQKTDVERRHKEQLLEMRSIHKGVTGKDVFALIVVGGSLLLCVVVSLLVVIKSFVTCE